MDPSNLTGDEVRAWAESLTEAMSAALREAKPVGGQMLIETRDRVTLLAWAIVVWSRRLAARAVRTGRS